MIGAVILAVAAAATLWQLWTPDAEPAAPVDPPRPAPLADGEHFAFISSIDEGGLLVDLARILSGQEAIDIALEEGVLEPGQELPSDFYISNPGTEQITIDVPDGFPVTVLTFDADGGIVEQEIDVRALELALGGGYPGVAIYGLVGDAFPVNVTVTGGEVTDISQVYLP